MVDCTLPFNVLHCQEKLALCCESFSEKTIAGENIKRLQEEADCKENCTCLFSRTLLFPICAAHGMHFLLWWLGKAYFFKLGLPCMVLVPCIRIACLSFLHISLSPCGFGTVFWWKNPAISAKKLNDLAKTMPEKIAIYTFPP